MTGRATQLARGCHSQPHRRAPRRITRSGRTEGQRGAEICKSDVLTCVCWQLIQLFFFFFTHFL